MEYGTAREKLGNIAKKRNAPSRYGTEVGQIPPGMTIEFVEVVPVQPLGPADKAGETWFRLPDGSFVNYQLRNSAGALVDYFTILTQPTPTEPGVTITGVRYSGEVIFDYSDGTQEVWHISDAPLTKGPAV